MVRFDFVVKFGHAVRFGLVIKFGHAVKVDFAVKLMVSNTLETEDS